jgi:hypothetical protein
MVYRRYARYFRGLLRAWRLPCLVEPQRFSAACPPLDAPAGYWPALPSLAEGAGDA